MYAPKIHTENEDILLRVCAQYVISKMCKVSSCNFKQHNDFHTVINTIKQSI